MKQRAVGIVLALLGVAGVGYALVVYDWWHGDSKTTHYEVGIQSYRTCFKGYADEQRPRDQWECEAVRFAGRVNRMNVSRKEVEDEVSGRRLSADEEEVLQENRKELQKFDDFASYGLFAGLCALLMMLGVAGAVVFGLLGRASGARPAGYFAAGLGTISLALTFAFYKAQPFDAYMKERGREALHVGLCLPLMLGGLLLCIVGAVLLARAKPGQPLFEFLPPNPMAFDDLPGFE